jgi:uncharacterized protein (DUF58 family)
MATPLPLLPGFMARAIERWAEKRLPKSSHTTQLDRRGIYILPTRNGMIFALVLLVILAGAMNYQNSMGYLLTFLTASIALLGMIYTQHNLNGLQIQSGTTQAVFAGQDAPFSLNLSHITPRDRCAIQLQAANQNESVIAHLLHDHTVTHVELPVTSTQRGYLKLPRVRIFSEFPLGLFYAWSWIELDGRCLVYPAPAEHAPKFEHRGYSGNKRSREQFGQDDFAGLRAYQPGDPPRHLAWKSIARSGVWQTKQFHADAGEELWLSWNQLPDTLGVEQRLSILCRGVLDAHRQGLNYGMEIPGVRIDTGGGLEHRHACLKALALFGRAA